MKTLNVHACDAEDLKKLVECLGIARSPGGEGFVIVCDPGVAPFSPQALHNLRGAVSHLRALAKLIESGYRCDAAEAGRYSDLLRKSHALLDRFLTDLEPLFLAGSPGVEELKGSA